MAGPFCAYNAAVVNEAALPKQRAEQHVATAAALLELWADRRQRCHLERARKALDEALAAVGPAEPQVTVAR